MAHNNSTPEWLNAVRKGIKRHWRKKFPTVQHRFDQYVDKRGPNECWEWKGNRNQKGYGLFELKEGGTGAHRVSYVLNNKISISDIDGVQVLHHCDNPPCVNPNHLFIGTNMDNVHDKIKKGRSNPPKGERNRHAKLTEEDVIAIRSEWIPHKVTHKMLGEKYGTSETNIQLITCGKSWKHIK